MIRFEAPKIEVWETNSTLRALMQEVLEAAGFAVCLMSVKPRMSAIPEAPLDLLVMDVEGQEGDFEARLQAYQAAQIPVLFCGLRHSREHYPDAHWLERPFSPASLLGQCRDLLGLDQLPRAVEDEEAEELPEDSASDTKRLTINETLVLEEALGLKKGKLSEELELAEADALAPTSQTGAERLLDEKLSVLELDGDDIYLVEDEDLSLEEVLAPGGELVGEVKRRTVDTAELETQGPLEAELDAESVVSGLRSTTMNSTLPDVPAVKRADLMGPGSSQSSRPSAAGPTSQVGSAPRSHVGSAPAARPGSSLFFPDSGMNPSPQRAPQTRAAADLLASAWAQIGCSARQGDRREHIQKIMGATLAQGFEAGQAQVRRIPAAPSFSGSLAILSLVDLLATIRDRTLRGRLELAIGEEYFVLYLDAQALDEMEHLTGNDEQLLLDILAQMGCLARADYDALGQSLSDPLAPPLRMQLRERRAPSGEEPRALVDADDLREARRLLTLDLFKSIRRAERQAPDAGNFAFMQILPDGGHAWPFDALGLNVDELLKAARREDSTVGQLLDASKQEEY